MINSRDLDDLEPVTALKCKQFIAKCHEAGVDVLITSTYRDHESQDALYARGRTAPGPKVTNAQGGQSFHNFRVAFDFVPIVDGKAMWNDLNEFKRCGKIAEALGLEWGGSWAKFKDYPHCQYTKGKTLKDLQEAHRGN